MAAIGISGVIVPLPPPGKQPRAGAAMGGDGIGAATLNSEASHAAAADVGGVTKSTSSITNARAATAATRRG